MYDGKLEMEDEGWTVEDGECIEDQVWKVEDRRWRVEDGG